MTVLITGANSFVGQALCRSLVDDGYSVKAAVRSTNSAYVPQDGSATIQVGEIGAKTDWTDALRGIDIIVHLAARVHMMHDTVVDPLAAFREVNVSGTERLIQMAAAARVKRLIYISSIKVNGEESSTPYTEQDIPNPQDAYAVSKWEAEQVLRQSTADTGVEVVIIRPPLVYGPGVKANFLQLIKIVNRGIPLPLSSVNNSRSVIYLGNLIDAIVACIDRPEAAGQTFLVSDGEDISTPELIRRVAAVLGKSPRLFPCPPMIMRLAGKLTGRFAEVERLLGSLTVDTSKIQRELGWKAPYTLEQGLRETAEWFLKSQM